MTGIKRIPRLRSLAVCICAALLLQGCGAPGTEDTAVKQAEGQADPQQEISEGRQEAADGGSWADKVLEVGILGDGSNPYVVVAFELFSREAGKSSCPIVVEFHDSRDGYDAQIDQLGRLMKRGVDVLLVDTVDPDRQEELQQELEQAGCPVIYFGTRPAEELLEEKGVRYIGLSLEEVPELEKALAEERFEEEGFWERARDAAEELLEAVLSITMEEK